MIGFFKGTAILCVSLCFLCASLPAACADDLTEDYSRVVLRVNGMDFHKWEMNLAEILTQDHMFREGAFFRPSEIPAFRQAMMESTIWAMLIYQEARAAGEKADPAKVDEFIWSFQKRFPSLEAYEKGLEALHVTSEQFRRIAERYVMTQDYLDRKFDPLSKVSEAEAREYYDGHRENFYQEEMVRASHILVEFKEEDGDRADEKALITAKRIVRKLKKGENFAAAAREYSDCESKKRGGDLGYIQKGDLPKAQLKPLEEVVFGMEVGEISEPVESVFGYHILYVEDKKPRTLLGFDEIKDKLIAKMTEDRKAAMILDHGTKLKETARIERLEEP
ncbi:PpiC-type peptidyl-prolyl cis-trans isomerase [Desulfatibacillum aliphaticivorans]|uniref:PpiC-type peptidyl-prolyl cis-trans isomerase n=1 Tax=Desulfatibacillum aliphaticivorans TaxID=218208 RepID=B8FKH0_DESAL|nr:peptidylprolyl isomerase [Desulfatibacillum aliphaticivorans]ACL01785.1 PpiC-type peptidyl-prolyl cis-trans isomerase [Desulfatibacillum aliphaticivorans]